jgi:hypothetical protein
MKKVQVFGFAPGVKMVTSAAPRKNLTVSPKNIKMQKILKKKILLNTGANEGTAEHNIENSSPVRGSVGRTIGCGKGTT